MPKQRAKIGITPVGDISAIILDVISANLQEYLLAETRILPRVEIPIRAWQQNRQQYDVGPVLAYLEALKEDRTDKLLGVMAVDLYIPILTHVFGGARQGADCGIVSIFRLMDHPKERDAPSSLVLERSIKVVLHEIGHMYNLVHCDDPQCLMHFSGSVDELDRLKLFFCRYCHAAITQRMGHPGRTDFTPTAESPKRFP